MIIGVSAKKQGGKTTVVDGLKEHFLDWRVVRFADKLKEIVIDCFVPPEWHWTVDDLDADEKKNTPLPCGKTVRQMLQIVGTDQFRHLWEDCWINAYGNTVSKLMSSPLPPAILTPDVRFPNELRYIQSSGGRVVRLTRAPFSGDTHESETALDPAMWATILHWDKFSFEESIQQAFLMDTPWVISMLAEKSDSGPTLSDLWLVWNRNPVLFDAIRDNRHATMDEQFQWVDSWANSVFE